MAISKLLACNDDVLCLVLESACLMRADLRAICLVHPHIRRLTEPILYSAVRFGAWKRSERNPAGTPHPISPFLRTILSRPELANHVRSFQCDGNEYYHHHFHALAPKMTPSELDLEVLANSIKSTWSHIPDHDSWIDELQRGTMDAYLALLLLVLPNLRSLHLGPDFCIETKWIGVALNEIVFNPSIYSLQHLNSVTLERGVFRWTSPLRNTTNLLPLFYLPSITGLSLSIDDPETPAIPWPATPPSTFPNIASLKLTEIRESHLGQLLAVTPRLQRLDWQWYFEPDHEDEINNPRIDLDLVMSSLSHLRDSLTELNLEAACGYANRTASPSGRIQVTGHPPAALTGFHQLKKLTIPLAFMTGFSVPAANSRVLDK